MLYKLRTKHSKRILWVLAIIIIISFVFFGTRTSTQSRKQNIIGEIDGKKITLSDFNYYFKMANLYYILFSRQKEKVSYQDLTNKAWELLLLVWKAKQDKIKV